MIRSLLTLAVVAAFGVVGFAPAAFAQAAAETGAGTGTGLVGIAAGIAIAVAAFGGALGQGRAVSSALDGIARNPSASGKIQTPMIIGLVLIESLVIYAFVIAFLLQGKF